RAEGLLAVEQVALNVLDAELDGLWSAGELEGREVGVRVGGDRALGLRAWPVELARVAVGVERPGLADRDLVADPELLGAGHEPAVYVGPVGRAQVSEPIAARVDLEDRVRPRDLAVGQAQVLVRGAAHRQATLLEED